MTCAKSPPSVEIRGSFANAAMDAVLTLLLVLAMGGGFLITYMGGIPKRLQDGTRVLDNHGLITPAGPLGWRVASAVELIALGALILMFPAALTTIAVRARCKPAGAPIERAARRAFLAAIGVLIAWGALLATTNIGPWLARQ